MAITQPTIDDFQDTTVMRVIRKVVNYLVTLIPKVNDEIDNINSLNQEQIDAVQANVDALNKELPTDIRVDYDPSTGNFNIDYVKEDGDVLTSNTVVIVSGSTGEVTIVQNTSGITINGTALQSATTAQPGLMTPALVSSLNNVNDTVNDHTTMINGQATAITELDDRVDALEQAGSGGEVWEEVDLANFPHDWVEGDRIKAIFYEITSNVSSGSWTTTISLPDFSPSDEIMNGVYEFCIVSDYSHDITIQTTQLRKNYNTAILVYNVGMRRVSELNNNNNNAEIFSTKFIWFNAAVCNAFGSSISENDLSTYVYKMWRLKK